MNALLPIEDALPALIDALRRRNRAVLQAPPGAGKTTRVPLALLEADLCKGRILMLEPRRLAARAAAEQAEPAGAAHLHVELHHGRLLARRVPPASPAPFGRTWRNADQTVLVPHGDTNWESKGV